MVNIKNDKKTESPKVQDAGLGRLPETDVQFNRPMALRISSLGKLSIPTLSTEQAQEVCGINSPSKNRKEIFEYAPGINKTQVTKIFKKSGGAPVIFRDGVEFGLN